MTTPAGWYPDPYDPAQQRWWNGSAWGEQTQSSLPPVPAPPPVTADPDYGSTPQYATPTYGGPATYEQPQFAAQGAMQHGAMQQGAPVPFAGRRAVSPWGRLGSYFLEVLLSIVTLGIGWLVWAAIVASDGQTPAKKLLGHQVVMESTGQSASFARMLFARGLLAGFLANLAIPLTLGIILFMPFWDVHNRNLWDRVSDTVVVYQQT